MNSIPKIQTGP